MVKTYLILLVLTIPYVVSKHCKSKNDRGTEWSCWNYRNFPTDLYNASTVEKLELGGNHIDLPLLTKLTSKDLQLYKLPNLMELQLEDYRFNELEPGAFQNGGKLVNLTLQWNEMEKLDPQSFTDLPNLQKLEISYQFGTNLNDFEIPEFANLENLTELILHYDSILSLKSNFLKNLKSLQILDLSLNGLTILDDREAFRPLKNLKVLTLAWNSITFVDPEVFADLQNLEILDLSHNKRFKGFKNGTQFHNPNLIELNLDNCLLQYIEEDLFQNLGNLRQLRLADNFLSHITQKMFSSLKNLEDLKLNGNVIKTLEPDIFSGLGNLTSLNLGDNLLKSLNWSLVHTKLPQVDDIEVFRPLKNLKNLNFNWNQISYVDPQEFADLPNLEILDLSNNKLDEGFKNGSKFQNINLIELDLSFCNLKYIHGDLFQNLGNLKELRLNRNRLSHIPSETFSTLKNLVMLSLLSNSINTLEPGVFSGMGNLTSLDLRHNQLKSLDWKVLRPLKKMSSISLYSNPWQCDCEVWYLRDFLKQRNIDFRENHSSPICETYGSKGEKLMPIQYPSFMKWKHIKPQELNCLAFPNITKLSADRKPKPGEIVNLQCEFTGDLPLQVVWMRGGAILRSFTLSNHEPLHKGNQIEYNDKLKIQNFKEDDVGLYKVTVSNEAGEVENSQCFGLMETTSTINSDDNTKGNLLQVFQSLLEIMF